MPAPVSGTDEWTPSRRPSGRRRFKIVISPPEPGRLKTGSTLKRWPQVAQPVRRRMAAAPEGSVRPPGLPAVVLALQVEVGATQEGHGQTAVGEQSRVPPAFRRGLDQGVGVGRRRPAGEKRRDADEPVVAQPPRAQALREAGTRGPWRRPRNPHPRSRGGFARPCSIPCACGLEETSRRQPLPADRAALRHDSPSATPRRPASGFGEARFEAAAVDVPARAERIGQERIFRDTRGAPDGAVPLRPKVAVVAAGRLRARDGAGAVRGSAGGFPLPSAQVRGEASRSVTRSPRRAATRAATAPAGPPPTMARCGALST